MNVEDLVAELKEAGSWLTKADEMLAKAAYQTAKNKVVLNSGMRKKFDSKVSSAASNLATAAKQSTYDKQMSYYSKAWADSMNAVAYADVPAKASGKALKVEEESYLTDKETEPDE